MLARASFGWFIPFLTVSLLAGCADSSRGEDAAGDGGAGAAGSPSGGVTERGGEGAATPVASTGASAGSGGGEGAAGPDVTATGGAAAAGTSNGGAPMGGVEAGGALGGAPTGGALTGGAATGGRPAGGVASGEGGSSTAGQTSGGEAGVAGLGGATGAVAGTSGAGDGTAGAGGAPTADCPATPPADGSPCVPPWEPSGGIGPQFVATHCSWGDDPNPGCRTRALCEEGAWQVSPPSDTCSDPAPADCGDSPREPGSACADLTLSCWYDDGTRCWCSECVGGSANPVCQYADPPEWACSPPRDGCYPMPQAGSPCTEEGRDCGLSCGSPVRCQDGRWQYVSCNTCCPICAAPDTPIATPGGERPIASLREGDLVYSVEDGAILAVPLLRVGHTPVSGHRVMRVVLDNGRTLEISPGHPTADGRHFGDLVARSHLDEQHRVVSAELVPYRFAATYDILPASSSGTYFAAGALVGSTLFAP